MTDMKTFFISCVVTALALAVTVSASGKTTMTLHDCMEYAISNSTKIRIREAEIGDARIARRDAILAAVTPTITASTYAYYNFGRSIDPQTNTYFKTTSFHNNYSISAGFDLFDGFEAVNNFKISKTSLLIAQSQEKQVEADICLAVMEAYYNVLYYKRLADIYEEQVATAELALTKACKQEEIGQKGHADVVQMEAELAERKYDHINAVNMYNDQLMTLKDLMFWPVEEELEIEIESVILSDSEESVVQFAIDNNPSVKIAGWQLDNAKRELNTAKWQFLPKIGLYAGWSTSYYSYQGSATASFGQQFKNNGGEYVELGVSIPLWDRLQRHSKVSRKKNAVAQAQAQYDQSRRDVESEVRRAVQDMEGSEASWLQASRKAEIQEEAYNLNLKKLEQGLISPLEFQTANANYLKAKSDEMNSMFKYAIKRAIVRYYNGVEYINQ